MVAKTTRAYVPDRGDVVRIDLDSARGHEQAKWRPALVLSPKAYNRKTSMMLVCPVTSQKKEYPFEVSVSMVQVSGGVLADQVRALEWSVRGVQYLGRADAAVLMETQAKLTALIAG